MIKRTVTLPLLTATLALLIFVAPVDVRAQVYEGVVAEDTGDSTVYGSDEISDEERSIYNYGPGENPSDIYKPDYFKTQADKRKANAEEYRAKAKADREAAQAAREAEWQTTEQAIDARVDAAVSAPSDYGTRIDGLKAPPPQMPETQPPETEPVTQPTPGTSPTPGTGTGGGTVGGGGASGGGGDRGGSVLERMMNELQ